MPETVRLTDQWGPVDFSLVPFAETAAVRLAFGEAAVTDPDSAMQQRMSAIRHLGARSSRRVAMAHAFLTGGQPSESERPLSVGGSGAVSASSFSDFQYVAMGHLHRPQKMEAGRLTYSGSLMKYSFEEASHAKGVFLVELDQAGALKQEFLPLPARRDVRVVEGFFNDIMQGPAAGEQPDDYLSFLLLDEAPVIQAVHRLRTIYPKTMEINYRYQQAALGQTAGQRPDHRALSATELFDSFAEWSTQKPLTELQRKTMAPLLAPVDGEGGQN
jgi:exonuclease SbcD